MTENLAQLKLLFSFPAASAGIAVFFLFRVLADLLLDEMISRKNVKSIQSDDGFRSEKDELLKYEKIIRKENVNYTWIIKAAGFLSTGLLAASALFHRMLLTKTGLELFSAFILILSASAAFLMLQDKRWKSRTADDLALYAFLFRAAAPDDHTGIRMMLSDPDTDIPLKPLLLEIQKDNPGISGTDLMCTAGRILNSGAFAEAFSGKPDELTGKTGREIHSGRTDTYEAVFVFSGFAVMIVLCFLL